MRTQAIAVLLLTTSMILQCAGTEQSGKRADWHTGLWWITESHVYLDAAELESAPPKPKDTIFMHKWVVERFEAEGGERIGWFQSIRICCRPTSGTTTPTHACSDSGSESQITRCAGYRLPSEKARTS